MSKQLIYLLLLAFTAPKAPFVSSVVKKHGVEDARVASTSCEGLLNPEGIDIPHPRLSWKIESAERNVVQTAYQLMVSSSKEKLARNEADLWNSGKINTDQSI